APKRAEKFLNALINIKDEFYPNGQFQLQFSIHSTDENIRRKWMPSNIWTLEEIRAYGEKWHKERDRQITLNFAVANDSVIDPDIIHHNFDPSKYFIKLTPVNPTNKALRNELKSEITVENSEYFPLAQEFRKRGFKTMISIGEWEENDIGTNCGQFATKFHNGEVSIKENYTTRKYTIVH
ncbi:MAG: radical SAM protein, partial [Candidatus Hodarchaeota archaeon]